MKYFYVPTGGPEAWQRFLAEPDKQWKPGYSAHALAHCWEAAQGFPAEVASLFTESPYRNLQEMTLLLAIPEHKVGLPGRGNASTNDLFMLAKDGGGALISITVEGKVAEDFGPTLADWRVNQSEGKKERLAYIQQQIGLPGTLPDEIRYQLLHRTASAVIEARRFNAPSAVMLVHSFSPTDEHFDDYARFVALYGIETPTKALTHLVDVDGISLYAGWVTGTAAE